jgi:hypothetical protein
MLCGNPPGPLFIDALTREGKPKSALFKWGKCPSPEARVSFVCFAERTMAHRQTNVADAFAALGLDKVRLSLQEIFHALITM